MEEVWCSTTGLGDPPELSSRYTSYALPSSRPDIVTLRRPGSTSVLVKGSGEPRCRWNSAQPELAAVEKCTTTASRRSGPCGGRMRCANVRVEQIRRGPRGDQRCGRGPRDRTARRKAVPGGKSKTATVGSALVTERKGRHALLRLMCTSYSSAPGEATHERPKAAVSLAAGLHEME